MPPKKKKNAAPAVAAPAEAVVAPGKLRSGKLRSVTDAIESNESARKQPKTNRTVEVFAAELAPPSVIIESPIDELSGVLRTDRLSDPETQPLRGIQVMMHAGGTALQEPDDPLSKYTTLPVAPAGTPTAGITLLYNIHELASSNTPAGAALSARLWNVYRESLSNFLGPQRGAVLQNQLRGLAVRLKMYPWLRVFDALAALPPDMELAGFAEQKPELSDVAQFLDVDSFADWANSDNYKAAVETKTHKTKTIDRFPWTGIALDDKLDNVYKLVVDIASAVPVDLATALGWSPLNSKSPPANVDAADWETLVGSAQLPSADVFEHMLAAYMRLAAKFTNVARRNSAYQYVFLFVWLPMRTGLGFEQSLGRFRPRPIAFSLVGSCGVLPLLSSALYAGAQSDHVFSLGHELVSFCQRIDSKMPAAADARTILRKLDYETCETWVNVNHNVIDYQYQEHMLLDNLFAAVQKHHSLPGSTLNGDNAPWLHSTLTATAWSQPDVDVMPAERTPELAQAVYATAAARIGAPEADRIYPPRDVNYKDTEVDLAGDSFGENHGEFAAPNLVVALDSLVSASKSLASWASEGKDLLVVVGPALGRLPLMMAYLNESLYCVCVPIASMALLPGTGPQPVATDWITPIAEAADRMLGGVPNLGRRVFVTHEALLSGGSAGGLEQALIDAKKRAGVDKFRRVSVLFNHYCAALQFDIPEPLFVKLATRFLKTDDDVRVFSTISLGDGYVRTPYGAASTEILPMIRSRRLSHGSMYAHNVPEIEATAPTMNAVMRHQSDVYRRALTESLGPGGSENPIYDGLRDAISDATNMMKLEAIPGQAQWSPIYMARVGVLIGIYSQLYTRSLITAPLPPDIAESLAVALATAESLEITVPGEITRATEQLKSAPPPVRTPLIAALDDIRRRLDPRRRQATVALRFDGSGDMVVQSDSLPYVADSLTRLNRLTLDGQKCVKVLQRWAAAVVDLTNTALNECLKNMKMEAYNVKNDESVSLAGKAAAVIAAWPSVASCLDGLVKNSLEQLKNVSYRLALGPSLLYAQMINDTLYHAQLAIASLHLDVRNSRLTSLRIQEEPFMQWFALMAGSQQDTTGRLSMLVFQRSMWIVPFTLGMDRRELSGERVSLRTIAGVMTRRLSRLLLRPNYWALLERKTKEALSRAKTASSRSRGSAVSDDDSDGRGKFAKAKANADALREQINSITRALLTMMKLFRSASDQRGTPTAFMLESHPLFDLDIERQDEQIEDRVVELAKTIQDQVYNQSLAVNAHSSPEQMLGLILDKLADFVESMAYVYINGGFDALRQHLNTPEAIQSENSRIMGDAVQFESTWRLPINFDAGDVDVIKNMFGEAHAAAGTALRNWIGLGVDRASEQVIDKKLQLHVVRESTPLSDSEEAAKDIWQIYMVMVPLGNQQSPDAAQTQFLRRYFAAVYHRQLDRDYEVLEKLTSGYYKIKEILTNPENTPLDSDAVVGTIAPFYQTFQQQRLGRDALESGRLYELTLENDDRLLSRDLLEQAPNKSQIPEFVKRQLGLDEDDPKKKKLLYENLLEDHIEDNPFNVTSADKSLLQRFLWTAYSKIQIQETDIAREWTLKLLVPMPELKDLSELHASFAPQHVIDELHSNELAGGDNTRLSQADIKHPLILRLLRAMSEFTPPETVLISTPFDEETIRAARSLTGLTDERRLEVWDNVSKRRLLEETTLYAQDFYYPEEAEIIQEWLMEKLYTETPLAGQAGMELHPETKMLPEYSSFVRLLKAAREDRRIRLTFIENLDALMALIVKQIGERGVSLEGGKVPFQTVFDSRFVDEQERAYRKEQIVLTNAQSNLWSDALHRLSDTLREHGAAETVAWWIRARASSWSQRLRMLNPRTADDTEWPWLLAEISGRFPDRKELNIRPHAALRSADLTNKMVKAFKTARNDAIVDVGSLVRTTLEIISSADSAKLAREFAGGGKTPNLLGMELMIIRGDDRVKTRTELLKRMADARKGGMTEQDEEDSDDEGVARSERLDDDDLAVDDKAETGTLKPARVIDDAMELEQRTLTLYAGQYQSPSSRFGSRVITDVMRTRIEQTLGSPESRARLLAGTTLGSPESRARLLAGTLTWYTRHVMFADAERNFRKARFDNSPKPLVDDLVAKVPAAQNDMGQLLALFADRFVVDSLLYGSLDSVISVKKTVPMQK